MPANRTASKSATDAGIGAPWVTATAVEVGKKQGKTVIVVRDGYGFYTSRILGPYMNEASFVLAEGEEAAARLKREIHTVRGQLVSVRGDGRAPAAR